jgi:iron complex transport system ATP-binding protein
MTMIFDNIGVTIGRRRLLWPIDARLEPGRVTVILGPNGAGKSTLLACAAGLRKPSSGRVLLAECNVARMHSRERARRIGFLPQSAELHWNIAAREVIALGRMPHRSPFAGMSEVDRLAIDLAEQATDTAAFADRPAGELSGGERARVLLARVLAGEPEWLLADEPLASLDPSHQIDVLDRLRGVAAGGVGVAIVLHDLTQAARVADDVMLLKEGRVVAFGPAEETLQPTVLREVYDVEVYIGRAFGGEPLLVPLRRSGQAG